MATIAKKILVTVVLAGFAQAVFADDLTGGNYRPAPGEAKGRAFHTQDMLWPTHGRVPISTNDVHEIKGVPECVE